MSKQQLKTRQWEIVLIPSVNVLDWISPLKIDLVSLDPTVCWRSEAKGRQSYPVENYNSQTHQMYCSCKIAGQMNKNL